MSPWGHKMRDKKVVAGLITAAEYARLNNKNLSSVKHHIASGRLPAQKIEGIWYIDKGIPYPPRVRYKDLTGQRFGMLTVKEHAGRKGNKSMWLCVCDCGRTKITSGNNLQSGYTKSCGCIGNGGGNAKDIAGHKFGLLTAIKPTDNRANNGAVIWLCVCDCGREHEAASDALIGNTITSCGCKKIKAGMASQKDATEAAKKSPKSGRFETNVNAKQWILIAPDGTKYECLNLSHWARAHAELFGFEPGDAATRKIVHGFTNLAQTFYGTRTGIYTYKGWRLEEAPEKLDRDDSAPNKEGRK